MDFHTQHSVQQYYVVWEVWNGLVFLILGGESLMVVEMVPDSLQNQAAVVADKILVVALQLFFLELKWFGLYYLPLKQVVVSLQVEELPMDFL